MRTRAGDEKEESHSKPDSKQNGAVACCKERLKEERREDQQVKM